MRCILLQGVNLNREHLRNIAVLYGKLKHCCGVELLPYHTYGAAKSVQLGNEDSGHPEWIPAAEGLNQAKEFLGQYLPIL